MAFTDDFNRSNQTLETSANWTRVGGTAGALEIVSNRVRCTTFGADTAYQAPDQGTADHYVQTKLLDIASYGGGASFIACRLANDSNYVGVRWTGSAWSVYRRTTAGSYNSIGSFASPAPALGDVVRLQCQGTNYALFRNGVSIGTGAIGDATLTSTRTGLVARSAAQDPWVDDFETGPLVLAVTGTLAATESGSDTLAASGVVLVQGALATAETGADIASGTGRVLVGGLLATTETGSDSAAISGNVLVSGTLAAVETGSDTFSGSSIEVVTPSWRRASVSAENRAAAVASESRSARCLAERRTAAVTAENRTAMVV